MKHLALIATLATVPALAQTGIYTKSYDSFRTSEQRNEATLTPANVGSLRQLPNIPVVGSARGTEGQPTIDSFNGQDIMVLTSTANVIRGVVANGGAGIWQTDLRIAGPNRCTPIISTPAGDMWRVNDFLSGLSTTVIDPATHKVYWSTACSEDGTGSLGSSRQRLFVLDTRSGAVLANTLLDGTSNGLRFGAAPRKQRGALALWTSTLYPGTKFIVQESGSYTESGPNAVGCVLMIDTYDNQVKATYCGRHGIWGSSQGPVILPDGTILLGSGNGVFNGYTDFGESAIRFQFVPPTSTKAATLTVTGDYTPFLDSQRECSAAALTQPQSQLNATTGSTPGANMAMNQATCDSVYTDQDAWLTWTYVPKFNQFIGAGKDGIGMVIPVAKFPSTQTGDFNTAASRAANDALVKKYQFGWNLGAAATFTNPLSLNKNWDDKTRHQHAPMPQFTDTTGTSYIFASGENSPIQAWKADATGTYHYVTRTDVVASAKVASGMPGAFCSVSDNSGANGILWCSVPDGDANRTVTTGKLYAFDLTQLSAGKMPQLWVSDTYVFNKFAQPIVFKGTVVLANYSGSVQEWRTN